MWNKIEREGKLRLVGGKAKQAIGSITGNKDLQAEGQVDEAVGAGEAAVGKAVRKVDEAVEDAATAITRSSASTD